MVEKEIIEQDLRAKKARLNKSTEDFKKAIGERLDDIKGNTRKWGTVALLVGGGIFVTYKVVKALTSKKEKQEPDNFPINLRDQENPLAAMIKQQIALFLFAIAKKKLVEYLQKNYDLKILDENKD